MAASCISKQQRGLPIKPRHWDVKQSSILAWTSHPVGKITSRMASIFITGVAPDPTQSEASHKDSPRVSLSIFALLQIASSSACLVDRSHLHPLQTQPTPLGDAGSPLAFRGSDKRALTTPLACSELTSLSRGGGASFLHAIPPTSEICRCVFPVWDFPRG